MAVVAIVAIATQRHTDSTSLFEGPRCTVWFNPYKGVCRGSVQRSSGQLQA